MVNQFESIVGLPSAVNEAIFVFIHDKGGTLVCQNEERRTRKEKRMHFDQLILVFNSNT